MPWGEDEPIELPPQPKTKEEPGVGKSLATGAIQGASLGFADELAGLYEKAFGSNGVRLGSGAQLSDDDTPGVRTAKETLLARNKSAPTAYEATRDSLRQGAREAQEAHPWAYGIGQAAGGLAIPVPGGALRGATAGARLLRAVGTGAGIGTVAGVGSSDADSAGGVAVDALISGGFGALGGAVAGTIGEGARLLSARAARGAKTAKADSLLKTAADKLKAFQKKLGAERSKVGDISRDMEVMAREAENLPAGNPLKAQLTEYLNGPEALRLREMVAGNKLVYAPERFGEHAALVAEREAASAAMAPEAVREASEAALENPLKTQVLPRLKTYFTRAIGPAIGGAVGGVPGAALGTLVSNTIGKPGTAMANMSRAPAVRNALWELVEAGTRAPEAAGRIANPLRTPVRSAGDRLLQVAEPTRRMRAVAETLQDHPDDEPLAGY